MRHNDARKWLHAALDLLPVLLIPVFMIYSHRHTMTQQTTVDIQYKYQSNVVNTLSDLVEGNIYYIYLDDELSNYSLSSVSTFEFTIIDGYVEFESSEEANYIGNPSAYNGITVAYYEPDLFYQYSGFQIPLIYSYIDEMVFIYDSNLYTFLLNNHLVPQYTDYNEIISVDVHDETSSVMNVFMDNFNGAVDNYFNMGNVFNLNGVYQWFNTNIFNGNAPQIIYSVWNIALYELVMDLLFLLYGLFMWFIDMCKHLMEKPFRSIK